MIVNRGEMPYSISDLVQKEFFDGEIVVALLEALSNPGSSEEPKGSAFGQRDVSVCFGFFEGG